MRSEDATGDQPSRARLLAMSASRVVAVALGAAINVGGWLVLFGGAWRIGLWIVLLSAGILAAVLWDDTALRD